MRWIAAVAALVTVVTLGVSACTGGGGKPDASYRPISYRIIPGGDPNALDIVFPFDGRGWCLGDFRVEVTETDSAVRVADVRHYPREPGAACADVGAVGDGTAGVNVQLRQPVGNRQVIRDSDGTPLTDATIWPSPAPS